MPGFAVPWPHKAWAGNTEMAPREESGTMLDWYPYSPEGIEARGHYLPGPDPHFLFQWRLWGGTMAVGRQCPHTNGNQSDTSIVSSNPITIESTTFPTLGRGSGTALLEDSQGNQNYCSKAELIPVLLGQRVGDILCVSNKFLSLHC